MPTHECTVWQTFEYAAIYHVAEGMYEAKEGLLAAEKVGDLIKGLRGIALHFGSGVTEVSSSRSLHRQVAMVKFGRKAGGLSQPMGLLHAAGVISIIRFPIVISRLSKPCHRV